MRYGFHHLVSVVIFKHPHGIRGYVLDLPSLDCRARSRAGHARKQEGRCEAWQALPVSCGLRVQFPRHALQPFHSFRLSPFQIRTANFFRKSIAMRFPYSCGNYLAQLPRRIANDPRLCGWRRNNRPRQNYHTREKRTGHPCFNEHREKLICFHLLSSSWLNSSADLVDARSPMATGNATREHAAIGFMTLRNAIWTRLSVSFGVCRFAMSIPPWFHQLFQHWNLDTTGRVRACQYPFGLVNV